MGNKKILNVPTLEYLFKLNLKLKFYNNSI